MSRASRGRLLPVAIDRIAAQWVALGGQLAGIDDRTPVDLDALVAITASLAVEEPRIVGVAVDWCVKFGTAIHAGRLQKVAREIGTERERLEDFGGMVAAAGGPRWPFAAPGLSATSRGKVLARDLSAPARIWWRTRAAFGVTARSDILTVLLTTPVAPTTIADLARRTRYTKRNVALAVAGMSLSGVVSTTRIGNRDRVWLERESPLRHLLEPDGTPDIDWATRWTVVRKAIQADVSTQSKKPSVRLVETRVVAEALSPMCQPAALPPPDLTVAGAAWADAFADWLEAVESWLGLFSA